MLLLIGMAVSHRKETHGVSGHGSKVSLPMLKKRLRDMATAYKKNNRDSMFRSGSSEEFKTRTWELLHEYVERSQVANDLAQQSRSQNALAERTKANRKAAAAAAAMRVKSGNSAPPSLLSAGTSAEDTANRSAFGSILSPNENPTDTSPASSRACLDQPPRSPPQAQATSRASSATRPRVARTPSAKRAAASVEDDDLESVTSSVARRSKNGPDGIIQLISDRTDQREQDIKFQERELALQSEAIAAQREDAANMRALLGSVFTQAAEREERATANTRALLETVFTQAAQREERAEARAQRAQETFMAMLERVLSKS